MKHAGTDSLYFTATYRQAPEHSDKGPLSPGKSSKMNP